MHVVRRDGAVAEDQLDGVVGGDAEPRELLVVRRELQQRDHLHGPRELRVLDPVAPVGLALDEVGEPDEGRRGVALVEEGGLEDDLGTALQRRHGLGCALAQVFHAHALGARDLGHPGAVLLAVVLQLAQLVLVPQLAGAHQHRVELDGHALGEPQLDVELPGERELALRRGA